MRAVVRGSLTLAALIVAALLCDAVGASVALRPWVVLGSVTVAVCAWAAVDAFTLGFVSSVRVWAPACLLPALVALAFGEGVVAAASAAVVLSVGAMVGAGLGDAVRPLDRG